MKKVYYLFVIVAGISFLTSCNKEKIDSPNSNEKVPMTFGITMSNESDLSTRATVVDLNFNYASQNIFWEEGDQVTIFAENHTYGDTFTFTGEYGTPKNTGVFSGMTYETNGYYGLYPAQRSAKLSYDSNGKGRLSFNIPSQQTARKNSFDPTAAIQIGKAESWGNNTLSLLNVCAYFSITVGPGCETVSVEAKSDAGQSEWYLAGNVTAEVSSASTAIKELDEANCQRKIVLSGDALKDGGTFLIPFIPSTRCPKIVVKTTFYPNTNSFNQPDKTFIPKNDANDESGKYQFAAGYIYELGTFESEKSAPTE